MIEDGIWVGSDVTLVNSISPLYFVNGFHSFFFVSGKLNVNIFPKLISGNFILESKFVSFPGVAKIGIINKTMIKDKIIDK
jgi:hypothetical protein